MEETPPKCFGGLTQKSTEFPFITPKKYQKKYLNRNQCYKALFPFSKKNKKMVCLWIFGLKIHILHVIELKIQRICLIGFISVKLVNTEYEPPYHY